ncbi:TetR/AcrR family transcriptional regulator [Mobiluncus mulieris]|uniref:TetR/AcrR family transcriptional regulator n=1 Tax=Mobiluncus mulieris TaxID=2052 RepID=UPI0020924796|nr:TetR/AcrR family transcriptional regulator [Mobiluncus mulieris]
MGKPSREVVVKELTNIFEELGYTGAGMAQISAATQLGRGSLYNLFPDGKSQMMHEVLAAVEAEFHDAVIAPLEAGISRVCSRDCWRSFGMANAPACGGN